MTVHRVEQRLKASNSLKDRLRSGRHQPIRQESFIKAFKNDPGQKMTRLAQKKNVSVSTVFRIVKKMGGIILKRSRIFLLSAAIVQKRLQRSTRWLNDLKNHGN